MLAYGYAKKYCMEHNLSVDKLMKQRFEITYGSAIFARPSNVKPEGLTTTNGELNRLNTQKSTCRKSVYIHKAAYRMVSGIFMPKTAERAYFRGRFLLKKTSQRFSLSSDAIGMTMRET